MHELGYCTALVDTLEELMEKEGLTEIHECTLSVGEATGVIPNYLIDCWPAAIEGTKVANCVLKVNFIHARGVCRECEHEYVISAFHGHCPKCGSEDYDMKNGYEFEVTEIKAK